MYILFVMASKKVTNTAIRKLKSNTVSSGIAHNLNHNTKRLNNEVLKTTGLESVAICIFSTYIPCLFFLKYLLNFVNSRMILNTAFLSISIKQFMYLLNLLEDKIFMFGLRADQ